MFGTSWHLAMDHLLTYGYDSENVVKAFDEFLNDYRKTFGPETDELYWPKTPDNAFSMLGIYAKKFRKDLEDWKTAYTEIAGKINLNEDQVLHFRMDSIMEHRYKTRVKSIEHKTGSNTWNWELQWPLSMQNGVYTHVMYCMYPEEAVEGVTFRGSFFKKSKKGWAQLNAGSALSVQPPYDFVEFNAKKSLAQMQNWLWHAQYYLDQVTFNFELLADAKEDDGVLYAFPMSPPSCSKWFGCEFLDFCQAWQNPLQRCHKPPLGYIEEHWDPSSKPANATFEINAGQVVEGGATE